MDAYKEMYLKLFNEITDVIKRLVDIQKEVEEIYLCQSAACEADDR